MAGAYVFPGGRVDLSDRYPQTLDRCDGVEGAVAGIPDLEPADAASRHIAAIRELFEEAGVLLARDGAGRFLPLLEPDIKARFDAYRQALCDGLLPLPLILETEGLRFALDALHPIAHWVTPEIESRRFDAWFFAARIPEGQVPLHDASETVHSAWISPAEALERYDRCEITLAPPTQRILHDLASLRSVDEVLAFARNRRIVRVQPRLVQAGDHVALVLPGDPLYPVAAGQELGGLTRLVLEEGRWRLHSPDSLSSGEPEEEG